MPLIRNPFFVGARGGIQQFLQNSLVGDGSDDYLEARTAADARFTQAVTGDWTLEIWAKAPTTLSANECIFSTNNTNILLNLIRMTYVDRTGVNGHYMLDVLMYDSTGAQLYSMTLPMYFKTPQVQRQVMHIAITSRFNVPTSKYIVTFFFNGLPIKAGASTDFLVTPSSFGFEYLTDRLVAGRYSDGPLFGTRFYTRCLSNAEILASYNGGKGSPVVGANCIFDFPMTNRIGNNFPDANGGSNKLTAVNFSNIAANMGAGPSDISQKRVVFEGNSLVYGTGTSAQINELPNKVMQLLNDPVTYECVYNVGIGSQTTQQIIDAFPTRGINYLNPRRVQNIYCVSEIINDLYFGGNAAGAISRITTLCQLAKAAGYQKVVISTPTPRTDVGVPGTFEADRQTVATYIRNNYLAMGADAYADVAADPTIGAPGASDNTTNYAVDKVHLNDTGTAIEAGIWATTLLSV